MPIYEYECSACKFYVETLQKISEPPLKKCPSCGKDALRRLISAPVFRLKGAGWYETDFKSDKENKRNLVDAGAEDKEPAAAADSDDKKPKVRSSKALKKAPTKKAAKKAAKKVVKKTTGKLAKPAKKLLVQAAAKKAPARKKAVGKKTAKRVAKKPAGKSAARKK